MSISVSGYLFAGLSPVVLQIIQYSLFNILINRYLDGIVNDLVVLNINIDEIFFLLKRSGSYRSFIAT